MTTTVIGNNKKTSKFNLGNKFSYFSHSPLVTTGNTLPEKILVYCTGIINTNENSKKPDNMNGCCTQSKQASL